MKTITHICATIFFLFSTHTYAANVSGIKLDEQIEVDAQSLVLNGAGVREKFIFDVYVIALYLPEKQSDAEALLSSPPRNRILMHFVYKIVEKEKLDKAWQDGFENNLSTDQMQSMAEKLATLKAMFGDAVKGDEFYLDYFPERGTRISINGDEKGWIEGVDFNSALLSVWLGNKPINKSLKNRLLGK